MNFNNIIIDIIKTFSKQINLDFDLICRIHIIVLDKSIEWMGKVNPVVYNDTLCFELFLQYDLLNDIISLDNDKTYKQKNIILHELFHCKEMSITSSHVNWKKLYFHPPIDTTKLLLFDTAIHQWSEYYAYYNSSQYYSRDINILKYLFDIEVTTGALHLLLIEQSTMNDIQINNDTMDNITKFIHNFIMFIANYNSTKDVKCQKVLEYIKCSSIYHKYYPYFTDLIYYMDTLYNTYPEWVSESAFIEIGYKLFSFIQINHITYSTNDLSDNFIFIKTDE